MRLATPLSLAIITAGILPANAGETWPERPVHVVVPWGGGSLADLVPRIIFDRISPRIGQSVVIENRPGAGGTIGAAVVAQSTPDGYILLVNTNAQVNAPLFYTKLSYDPARDLIPVALLATYPDALVVASSTHIGTLEQFVRAAKTRKNGLTFAAFGAGSAAYMGAERFRLAAKYDAVQVPFKGAPAAIREVMEGRVDFCFCGVGTSLPFIRDGKLTALAISTPARSPLLPNVPTTLEAGFLNSDYTPWIGLFAPAHTQPDIVRRLHDAVVAALGEPSVREKLAAIGTEPVVMSTAEFEAFAERDFALSKTLVEALALKPR
jgi:tripartite-type tricarboxylate transporter receptor subunit TctC